MFMSRQPNTLQDLESFAKMNDPITWEKKGPRPIHTIIKDCKKYTVLTSDAMQTFEWEMVPVNVFIVLFSDCLLWISLD